MKIELNIPPEVISAIACEITAHLQPLLIAGKEPDDPIFTIDDLMAYLRVPKKWVYEQTRQREIPFFKTGKFIRFRKSEIDRWIEGKSSPATVPAPPRLRTAR